MKSIQFLKSNSSDLTLGLSGEGNFTIYDKDAFNDRVKLWSDKVNTEIKTSLAAQTNKSNKLSRSISFAFKKKEGEITRLSLKFSRVGIYIHYGASKGHGGYKGSKWESKGEYKYTDVKSMGRMNYGARRAKPFFMPIIEKNLPELSQVLVDYTNKTIVRVFKQI